MGNRLGDRIEEIYKESGFKTIQNFGDYVGFSHQSFHKWKSGEVIPGADIIIKLLEKYSQYNAEWLLLGTGEKRKTSKKIRSNAMAMEPEEGYGDAVTKRQLKVLFKNISDQIEDL